MIDNYSFDTTGPRLYGIFGDPVAHSLSPLMHNTAFRSLKYNGVYLPFHIRPDDLPRAVEALRVLGIAGVNVTVPYKKAIAPLLDDLEGDALLTGSVNTVQNQNGRLVGYSTDGHGLIRSLAEEVGWNPRGESAIIIGTGGAATAIATRFIREGIERLLILTRSEAKGRDFTRKLQEKLEFQVETGVYNQPGLARASRDFTLVINATPVGMGSYSCDEEPPFPPEWIAPEGICCDLIYNPLETGWLRRAKEHGHRTLNGLGMLIYQGADSFRIWTGLEMPVPEIRQILERKLDKKG